jgi:D-cysteine desulfhydrase family pyridoxal phosphate-dependent enzyme
VAVDPPDDSADEKPRMSGNVSVSSWNGLTRVHLASSPTPLESSVMLPGGVRLWIKRDDLTGLALGGNKARKLEFLCGEALDAGADCLITVGASQSNHCRMTAAAGALMGIETHLVLSGDRPERFTGNQLLSDRLGAHQHFNGAPPELWGVLEISREELTEELESQGLRTFSIPIGGSTSRGALGYVLACEELLQQCDAMSIRPASIVVTSSSGGTHAGLVAGRAWLRFLDPDRHLPEIIAVGVAKGVVNGKPSIVDLARSALEVAHLPGIVREADVVIASDWLGPDYAVPTPESRAAQDWAARFAGILLDDVYTAKGMAGLLGLVDRGHWKEGDDVVFIHTGGHPELFAVEPDSSR